MSERSLLTPPGERIREGVWAATSDDCAFDEAAAVTAWPDCATASVVKDGVLSAYDQGDWRSTPVVVDGGDPALFQFRFAGGYGFYRVSHLDRAEGGIAAFTLSPIACPPAPGGVERMNCAVHRRAQLDALARREPAGAASPTYRWVRALRPGEGPT